MLKKIATFFLFGIFITIFLAQFDPWTHNKIKTICQNIAHESLGCKAFFTIESLNFFSACLVLTNVEMTALDDTWSWKCARCEIYSSWIQLFLKGIMDRHITMEEFECSSSVCNGTMAIEPHIIALNAQSLFPIPTDIKSIVFKNSSISLYDENKQGIISLFFNSSSLKVADRLKTMMSIYDGNGYYHNTSYCNDIVADILFSSWYENDTLFYSLNYSGLLYLPQMLDEGTCYISGMLESGRGRFSVRNAYNSFTIDPIIITEQEIRAESNILLSYIAQCIMSGDVTKSVGGNVNSFVRIDKKEGKVDGHLVIQDGIALNTHICDAAKIIFARKDQQWKFRLNIARHNEECKGIGHWSENLEQGRFEIHNHTPLSSTFIPHWRIMPKNFLCDLLINKNEVAGIYKINTTNTLTKACHVLHGGISYEKQNIFVLNGFLDDKEFTVTTQLQPTILLRECLFFDKDKKAFISLQESQEKELVKGHISFTFIRNFINTFFHYDIQGEGLLTVDGKISSSNIAIDIALEDATIRLPETYNFIDGLQSCFTCDTSNKLITFNNLSISLHTGTINCLQATASFNERGKLIFAHAPFLLDHCLFNIKKDLFAIVSGNLLFLYNNNKKPCVSGNIIIDRAQLKENLFSSVLQKRLFAYTHSVFSLPDTQVMCDLSIETKSPIRVDTAFLQTNAKVNLKVQNNIIEPTVSGTIVLQSGNLIFPYKPLFINKGALIFSSDHFLDPAIELVARNKIKNYDITLQVAGSLLNHHIMLDSTPPLSEEQIMALLLVGSHDSSLNSMIPALIVQNLKNLIFTHNQSTFLEKYFAPLLRPFNISLIPSFADQTGRGGLRGMLEISINDRWKALIQKNFNLTEDTRVELEFLLSDDITLRGIRDERRDLGGEVEMRWKF